MRSATFGPLNAVVPLVGQGTWNLEREDPRKAVEALEAGIDAGMTHIDTAELYGNGRVERLLRGIVEGRRDDLFLVSKVLPQNGAYRSAIQACERSLKRLGTDRLDVYLLHWRGSVPLEETIRAFDALVEAGKIGAWGVSNFDVDDLEEALSIAGEGRIACNQVLYHLGERSIEHRVVPWCRAHRVAVVAYSPFGSGRFPSPRSDGGKVLEAVAKRRSATPHQIALAFLIRRAEAFAIPKAAAAEHARENAAAADLELDADDMRAIDEAFPARPKRSLATL
ncbi:MAG TPA: aldo/keto reductase [Gammaproteobacteria bacterium]|nr:aldo/keto reductase [Gammaproteobacteria bacterium]